MYAGEQTTAHRRRNDTCTHRFQRLTLEIRIMLETIAVVLLLLWALGLVTAYTMGGFIHVLLVVAIVVVLVRVIQGRRL
jgi:Family of unknown function (DUF5670)